MGRPPEPCQRPAVPPHGLRAFVNDLGALRCWVVRHLNVPRLLKLYRTDYGRSEGWEVYDVGDAKVAELLHPYFDDMFWYTYELAHIDPRYEERLKTIDFWYEGHPIRFRSKALGEFASNPAIMIVVNQESPDRSQVAARRLWLE